MVCQFYSQSLFFLVFRIEHTPRSESNSATLQMYGFQRPDRRKESVIQSLQFLRIIFRGGGPNVDHRLGLPARTTLQRPLAVISWHGVAVSRETEEETSTAWRGKTIMTDRDHDNKSGQEYALWNKGRPEVPMGNLRVKGCCSRPIGSTNASDESVRELSRCLLEASMSSTVIG